MTNPNHVLLLLTAALAGPVVCADDAARFEFHDVTDWKNRSTITYTALQLHDDPPRIPSRNSDGAIPGDARWGLLRLGESPDDALLCAVAAEEAGLSFWLDSDGDGALAPGERQAVTDNPAEFRVVVRRGERTPLARTAVLRRTKFGDGLQYAVRGACAGEVTVAGTRYAALLTDCDGNGLFHSPAADRILIDLDQDGRFDGITEQFPLGRPIDIGGEAYFAAADAAGERVWIRPRSKERGRLRVRLFEGAPRDVERVSVALVSELGEAELIAKLDEPIELPVGRYRVSSLALELRESSAWQWLYLFDGSRDAAVEVHAGKEAALTLLDGLRLSVDVRRDPLQSGGLVSVTPSLGTPSGLTLVHCERKNLHATYLREWRAADIFMIGPEGRRVALATSGFA